MPYPPQIFSLDGHAYGLTVSGVQVIQKVPTDLFPLRWEMPSEATNGGISFTILDEGETVLPAGSVVRLTDNVNNDLLASGVLVNRRFARHAGPYRRVECGVVGWGWYLDNRIVTEYAWEEGVVSVGPFVNQVQQGVVRAFGGAVMATSPQMDGLTTSSLMANPGTVTNTTVRGALSSIYADASSILPFHMYVTNDAEVRWRWSRTPNDAALGTAATSIGDQGDYIPESLVYEVGSENRANLVAAYGTAGDFLGWGWVGAYVGLTANTPWEAGQPSTSWQDEVSSAFYTLSLPLSVARAETWQDHADITSISFTTTEHGGWKPHQILIVDDSMLTGGSEEAHYIAAVSGSIDYRNIIEWQVTTGAIGRSLVQTVAAP